MNPNGPRPSNRRISSRRQPKGNTRVCCLKGTMGLGENLAISAQDISETGIRVVLKSALKRGDDIEITLQSGGPGKPVKLQATVVWSFRAGESVYHTGVRFQKPLSYADLAAVAR